jgi:CheY-like chemotaxis protein
MDLGLPGISGAEATERIKANPAIKDIPIVINTAFSATELTRRALAAGAAEILHKPIELMVLRDTLRKYLSKESRAAQVVVARADAKLVDCIR